MTLNKQQIRIELDSVRKDINGSEWRRINRASACGMEEIGDGMVIVRLCQRLLEAGYTGEVVVFRGEIPCFNPLSLELWAGGGLREEQPLKLRKNRETSR